jgi:hypothetical protein
MEHHTWDARAALYDRVIRDAIPGPETQPGDP